jgi:hypothetical protein
LGCVQLDAAGDIKKSTKIKRKHCLEIPTPKRTYYMCAENDEAMEDWIRELTAERDRIQGKTAAGLTNADGGVRDFQYLSLLCNGFLFVIL